MTLRRGQVVLSSLAVLAGCAVGAPFDRVETLFVVSFSPGAAWQDGVPMSQQPGLRAHGENMARLFAEGRIYAAGPYMQDDGAAMGEGGMMIVRARSREEVELMLAADPAIMSGVFVARVARWRPRFREAGPLPSPPD